jgi:hypothetical protein
MIAAKGFVYISNSNFADFAVANASYCAGGGNMQLQLRSVPTTDRPECLVNYCACNMGTSGAGGM